MPKVSVIIPTYNNSAHIARAIDSVLIQTYRDIEIIVVNDGSTDDTEERLRAYGDQIRYIYQENQERSAARNTGMRHAQGEFIAFLDTDDYWLPNKLQQQIAILEQKPEIDVVYSRAYLVDDDERKHGLIGHPIQGSRHEIYHQLLFGNNIIPSPTPVVRQSCCRQIGDFDLQLCQVEDLDYWLRVSERFQFWGISEPLACYRVTLGNELLTKMVKGGVPEKQIQLIEKALCRRSTDEAEARLALSLAHLYGSLIYAGAGNLRDSFRLYQSAKQQEPDLFTRHIQLASDMSANLASQVCRGQPSSKIGVHMVKTYWQQVVNCTPTQLRQVLAKFYRNQFFQESQRGNRTLAFFLLFKILKNNPLLLFNRGVWSTIRKSLIK